MSTTFASLGIAVESSQAVKAADDLDKLVDAAEGAEKAVDDLGKAGEGLASTGKKISQAETEAAQGIDKATSAKERQVDASRKAGTSAASEIAIISQLDRAMTGNIDSMEKLVQAEGLLERARKGGLVTIEQQEAYQERLGKSFDRIEKAEAKEAAQKQRLIDAENRQIEALKRTVNSIDPLNVKLAKLEAQEKAAHEAFRLGAINAERYNEALAKIGKDRAGLTATESAFDKLKLGTRQAQENVMQLSNALQSGDWGSGARAVAQLGVGAGASASSFIALAGPVALASAAIGGLAYAYYKGSKETSAFNDALILTGNYAGTSAGQLSDMARQVSSTVGTTGAAADVLATLAGNGKLASGSFSEITKAALSMEEATGKSIDATIAEFVKIADDPVAAAKSLNDQYHFLTASVYSQIVALKDQGDEIGATKLLTDTYADTVQSRSRQVLENLNLWERAWRGIKIAANDAVDGLSNAGRLKTFNEQIKELQSRLTGSEAFDVGGLRMNAKEVSPKVRAEIEGQIRFLELQRDADQERVKFLDDQQKANDLSVESQTKLNAQLAASASNAEKLKARMAEIESLAKGAAGGTGGKVYTEAELNQLRDAARKQFSDKPGAAGAVDLTAFNNSKNTLTGILSEYKNAQKELDAAQKAGLISQADYLLKREALIGNERDEVTAAYQAEIDALEAAKAKKGVTAAQGIQLDQKISDARAAMVKAQKDADSQLNVLAINEKGRIEQQTAASKAYVDQLERQRAALEAAGSRAATGLGLGDRQAGLQASLDGATDKFNEEQAKLLDRRKTAPDKYSKDDYERDLASLESAEVRYRDTVVSNYDKMSAAQGDWRNGATSAFQNYLESARDVAGQTKSLFTNAFGSMEDAIVQFAMTGKLSFADFTKSILADMARIAVRQASSSALSSLFGMAASAAGSYFGGGAASAGSTQAGYTGVDFSSYQANGGAWGAGVQMFANGGAFTNSIVSKPTAFGMAGGNTGVMGEAGPEAIVPLARTSGGQLGIRALGGDTSSSSNQVVIQQTFNIPEGSGGASEADGQVLAQAYAKSAKQGAQEQIAKDLRPGGQIYMAIRGRS